MSRIYPKVQKILFFNPPDPSFFKNNISAGNSYFEPPIGLLYVYNYIKNYCNFEASFYDLNIELKYLNKQKEIKCIIHEILLKDAPQMVCLAALYYSGISIFKCIAELIKGYDKDIIVIMGGHYPTHMTQSCLDNNVDFAILSEGELALAELIEAINLEKPFDTVEGIAYRQSDTIIRNKRTKFWKGFSKHRRLPWEDTPFHFYFREGRNVLDRVKHDKPIKMAAITASRGCPNNCTFCSSPSFWYKRWCKRDVDCIIKEIRYLQIKYDVNTIIFNDENIAANRKWFLGLLDALTPLNITWISSGGLSVRSVNDDEITAKMIESGIGLFNLAIESGSNKTLERVNKTLTIQETQNVIKKIRDYPNSYVIGFFIIGFPFETWSDIQNTIRFAQSLDLDWKSIYCFQPFPGSELYQYCIDKKILNSFNPNYGDIYFASKLQYNGYSSEQLSDFAYESNLLINFTHNRNIKIGSGKSLEQAKRDFQYVANVAQNHAFAYSGMAVVAKLQNNLNEYNIYVKKAAASIKQNWRLWSKFPHALKTLPDEIQNLIS